MVTAIAEFDTAAIPVVDASPSPGLSFERRYEIVSVQFADWLVMEPIQFPPQHPTYGWACRVSECEGAVAPTHTTYLCDKHAKQYSLSNPTADVEDFISSAEPIDRSRIGFALKRFPECTVEHCSREASGRGLCTAHGNSLAKEIKRGGCEIAWRRGVVSRLPALQRCSLTGCAHDGALLTPDGGRICRSHHSQWRHWLRTVGGSADLAAWRDYLTSSLLRDSLGDVQSRGRASLSALPARLQAEIRFALHRHCQLKHRVRITPATIRAGVDALARHNIQSLAENDQMQTVLTSCQNALVRRGLTALVFAARSLTATEISAKEEGWFDPVVVGAAPFPDTQTRTRRKPWVLTEISQRWLRDLAWEYCRDMALLPEGKRPSAATVHQRMCGAVCLSGFLRQHRDDGGVDPEKLGPDDASLLKEVWDIWFREKIPIARLTNTPLRQAPVLTTLTRMVYMKSIRILLQHSRDRRRTCPELDSFTLALPMISRQPNAPRPRPMAFGEFQTLVAPANILRLEAADRADVGLADIWLVQAFQGGRIGETLGLRLGCIGLVGNAQPYIWRDITKNRIVDHGVPCHLPVYERLLARQEKTRSKLRRRYGAKLSTLSPRERQRVEDGWEQTMPLFPRSVRNPDLVFELSQDAFRRSWGLWLKSLGVRNLKTHQTRATLATSLLNNGAPPALVRQMLGHFSPEALVHYASYNNESMTRHLQQVWAAGPGMDKPGTILLRPAELDGCNPRAAADRIDLTVIPVEHGLCRYGPVVGGSQCPKAKHCTTAPDGPCEHFVLTGADLTYWERKRDAAYHFAEGAPNSDARDYILNQWEPWESVLNNLREALNELGLLEEAEKLDLRTPLHDYFSPVFATGWQVTDLQTGEASHIQAVEQGAGEDGQ